MLSPQSLSDLTDSRYELWIEKKMSDGKLNEKANKHLPGGLIDRLTDKLTKRWTYMQSQLDRQINGCWTDRHTD